MSSVKTKEVPSKYEADGKQLPRYKTIPHSSALQRAALNLPVSLFTIQCCRCSKFRLISTPEEYERIRKYQQLCPWYCSRKANISCHDPTDVEYDASRTWIADKPGLPRTPHGFRRDVVVPKDYSKCKTYYTLPNGIKVSSLREIKQFLKASPEYRSMAYLSDFDFTSPLIMENTVPRDAVMKNASTSMKVKAKPSQG